MPRTRYLLGVIFLLGAIIRGYNLTSSPPSLNWDEVSHGYTAYSVLKTGTDEWGELPITNFRAYGDYPTTGYMYLTLPFVALLGPNALSVRLPSFIVGSLLIPIVYFLGTAIWGVGQRPLILSALIAFSPWHILQSRAAFQSTLSISLTTLAVTLFLHRKKNEIFLPASIIVLTLTLFSYHTSRIVSPILFVIALFSINSLREHWKNWKTMFSIAFFVFALALIITNPHTIARGTWVSLIDTGAINRINELRSVSHLPLFLTRLLYNKVSFFLVTASSQYVGYFTPKYLFLSGGTQYQYSIPGFGLMHQIELPFFYLGVVIMCLMRKYRYIFSFLLISPLPAAITSGQYHVLRSSLMLPFVYIPVVVALVEVYKRFGGQFRRYLLTIVFVFALAINLTKYLFQLHGSYRRDYSWAWQFGYKEAVNFINEHPEYKQVIITKKYGEPHQFVLFYSAFDPAVYKSDSKLLRYQKSNWYWVDKFSKYYFLNDWQIKDLITESGEKVNLQSPSLLITSPGNYTPEWSLLKTLRFLDGSSAFDILEKL